MDSNVFTYQMKRKDFGKQPHFTDSAKVYDLAVWPNPSWDKENRFLTDNPNEKRNPNFINLSTIPEYSENTVNTERVNMDTKKMFHYEGGWPNEVDITEEKSRHNHVRKRLERNMVGTDVFIDSCRVMTKKVKDVIKMNNQIDMYEEYFDGEAPDHNIEKLSVKTSMLFKDPEKDVKRSINKISWHPDGPHKLVGAYCLMRFQNQPLDISRKNPNSPVYTIEPPSPIVSLAYNHKNTDEIAFGCYNGRVGWVDTKQHPKVATSNLSSVEFSHHEPVVDLFWLSSKLNNEFVTCSTDGQICWWDNRKMEKPTDRTYISEYDQGKTEEGLPVKIVGGTSMEFIPDHGPKYLLGTEKGSIMNVTKKNKKSAEVGFNTSYGLQMGRHLGPVYSIKRNPFNYKYFLSVGDWSVSIWEEEMRTPIMRTRYHSSYLTDGCWAPQRPGVFFVTRKDGWLDIWDYYYRQNEVAFSHKVSNASLTAIKLNTVTGTNMIGLTHPDVGKYAAIGDNNGTITLLELCQSLYEPQFQEKEIITEIFEREKKREEHLKGQRARFEKKKVNEAAEIEAKRKAAEAAAKVDVNKQMSEVQDKFEKNLKKAADELYKVYLNDKEMTTLLAERLAHAGERKATKNVNQAEQVIKVKPNLPSDYDKKANELTLGESVYSDVGKATIISTFIAISSDTCLVQAHRLGDAGKEVCKLIHWKCTSPATEKEIFSFDRPVEWNAANKDKKASEIEQFVYLFIDYQDRVIGIEKFGKIVQLEGEISKGVPLKNPVIIGECYVPDKCGAAISKDRKSLYYIDREDPAAIWKHNLQTGARVRFLGTEGQGGHDISGFCLMNEETLFISFKNFKVARFDMNKKNFERAILFDSCPLFVTSFLNHVAVVGDLKDKGRERVATHEIILLDSELREVGRFDLKGYGPVVHMSMKMSVGRFPIIFFGTGKELFALKANKDGVMTRLALDVDLKKLRTDGILNTFKIYNSSVFVSDRGGLLFSQVKGSVDDMKKMEDLADHLEEMDDAKREKEDQMVDDRAKQREAEKQAADLEAAKKAKEQAEAALKREAELKKELDRLNKPVSFTKPELIYQKVNGPRFDKFVITDGSIYTISEEGHLFNIKKYDLKNTNAAPALLFQSIDKEVGTLTDFAANPDDDSCFFMIGTKLIKCVNKKLEVVCETTYQMWHYGEYFIARGTRGNEYHFYHYPTQNLSTETHNYDIKSAYRNAKFTYIITGDKKLIQLQGSNKIKEVPINFESEVKIVHADDYNVLVVAAAKDTMGNLETFVHAFDNEMRLLASNRFSLREVSDFKLSNFNIIPATETAPSYLIMNYVGANMPIILRKSGDGKYTQPKIFNLHLPGVTTFNELRTLKHKIFIGTGRKIYESTLLEKEVSEDTEKPVKPTKETPIVLTAVYKDKMTRFKQVGIDTKEMGADVLLSRVVLKSDTPDHIFISKNDAANKTQILRYNFNTQSELAVVKEVSKLDRKGYLVDFVVNQANRINAIDDNGFYYHEAANDLMVLTDLMTFGRRNNFNFSRSRQIATNANKDKGYLVTDDGGAILEVDLLQENTYRALREDLYGILEIKVTKNDVIFGVRQVLNKSGRLDYILFKYDIATQKLIDEGNMNLPLGYHFEAIRLVDDKKVLVVANKRRDNDSKSGTSGEMVFALFNTNLEREFMSADTPVGNKFGVSNVIEVLAVLEGFPVIMVSKAATLYLYAIETDSKIKLVDSIHFSNADDDNSTIESACFHENNLYVVRNKNTLHRVRFSGLGITN